MDLIYTWCENHGIKWFYNPFVDIWEFQDRDGSWTTLTDPEIKNYTRTTLRWLESFFS